MVMVGHIQSSLKPTRRQCVCLEWTVLQRASEDLVHNMHEVPTRAAAGDRQEAVVL